jgi:hypothetical protein
VFVITVVICFSYFASLEVLFSIWFFDLIFILEGGTLNRLGVNAISPNYRTGRFIWQTAVPLLRLTSFTIFLAWLVKFIMLKLVGASFYKRTRPFFVGTLIGYVLLTTLGLIVDVIWFGKQGHTIHKWY